MANEPQTAQSDLDALMSSLQNSLEVRHVKLLLAKASRVGECLECHLSNVTYGYSYVKGEGRAHRYVYRTIYGDPKELFVLHKCDNRRCINPFHLFAGTHQDNMDDMAAKGRHVPGKGGNIGATRTLTPKMHREALELYDQGLSQRAVATEFGVSQRTIQRYLKSEPLDAQ